MITEPILINLIYFSIKSHGKLGTGNVSKQTIAFRSSYRCFNAKTKCQQCNSARIQSSMVWCASFEFQIERKTTFLVLVIWNRNFQGIWSHQNGGHIYGWAKELRPSFGHLHVIWLVFFFLSNWFEILWLIFKWNRFQVHSDWNYFDHFVTMHLQPAFRVDAQSNSHPMTYYAEDPHGIEKLFDLITYEKGNFNEKNFTHYS